MARPLLNPVRTPYGHCSYLVRRVGVAARSDVLTIRTSCVGPLMATTAPARMSGQIAAVVPEVVACELAELPLRCLDASEDDLRRQGQSPDAGGRDRRE